MNEFFALLNVIMLLGILCFSILKSYASQVYRLASLIIGMFIGIFTRFIPNYRAYTSPLLDVNPRYLLALFFVCNVFKIAQGLDYHVLRRCWKQIILLATISFPICALGSGIFITMVLLNMSMSEFSLITTYGVGLVLIETHELTNRLEVIPFTKHLQTLINGEKIFTEAFAMVTFNVCLSIYDNLIVTPAQISVYFLKNLFGGLFIGLLFGMLIRILLRTTRRGLFFMAMLFVTTPLAAFYCATKLSMNGALSIMTLGIFASIEKRSMSSEDNEMMNNFFRVVIQFVNTLLYTAQGILLTERIIIQIEGRDMLVIFVSLAAVYTFRLLTTFLMAPLLSRIEYGLTIQQATITSIGVTRGGTATFLGWVLLFHEDEQVAYMGKELFCVTCFLQIFTCILDICMTPLTLKYTGLSKISLARKNNMNTCIKHINSKSEQFMSVLKMDKFLVDAKWQLVAEVTKLRNPYTETSTYENRDEMEIKETRYVVCPDCLKEVPQEPTLKELADMTREARMRVLKAKRVSYVRQHENGMLSNDAFRTLNHALDLAMDAKDAILKLDELFKMFRFTQKKMKVRKKKKHSCFQEHQREVRIPKTPWRRIIYKIVLHPYFSIVVYIIILMNCALILYEVIAGVKEFTLLWLGIMTFYFLFYIVYLFEFIITRIAYSTNAKFLQGVKNYFNSFWNVFDLVVLVCVLVNFGMDICEVIYSCHVKGSLHHTFKVFRLLLLIRILTITSIIYRKMADFQEFRRNKKIMLAYEIGRGYLKGNEGIDELIRKTIDNKHIRDDCKQRLLINSQIVTRQLGLIEKEKPWITNMVNTKLACLVVLNEIRNTAFDLKVSGWIDDVEYSMMKSTLDQQFHTLTKMKWISPNTPKEIFKEIPWIYGDEALMEYLFSNIITKIFDVGEDICTSGLLSDGVFILISGLLRLSYIPKQSVLDKMNNYGILPVVDWLKDVSYKEIYEEYIMPGNSFGEISVLTGNPFACTIVAETPVQTYVLSREILRSGFEQFSDPINGLEARMWKTVALRIVPKLLLNEDIYQSYTVQQIQYQLVDAIVPNLTNYKTIGVTHVVQDIVILNGVVQDFHTGEYFIAPRYIPRSVQKLILPSSSQYSFEQVIPTNCKLVLIPEKGITDAYDIVAEIYISSDVNYSSSLNLILQEKTKNYKRRKITAAAGRKKNHDVEIKASFSRSPTLVSDNTLKTSFQSSLNVIFEDKQNTPHPVARKGQKKSTYLQKDRFNY